MKTRILHVYPQLNCGGTEMVIYNLVSHGDFCVFSYEILIQCRGDNEAIFSDIDIPLHLIPLDAAGNYYTKLVNFFKKERFDVVHAHMHKELPLVLRAAKEAGVKCRVAHSHNARVDIPHFLWPLMYPLHHSYEKYATQFFGCSHLALQWLFPMRWKLGNVIYNGIDLNRFRFDGNARMQYRNDNAIAETTKVFVNVGRCTNQKNQIFILELARERIDKNELYIIIGDGPMYTTLQEYIITHNLDNVRLLGKRNDVAQWLSAADSFLFPSVYEGLGIVAVEAEASGLTVLATNTIPCEADMHMGNFHSIALSDKARWHEMMSMPANTCDTRRSLSEKALSSEYNIVNVARQVESLYNV